MKGYVNPSHAQTVLFTSAEAGAKFKFSGSGYLVLLTHKSKVK